MQVGTEHHVDMGNLGNGAANFGANNDDIIEKILDELDKNSPPVWERPMLDVLTGGMVKAASYANMQSRGEAPPSIYFGRKACVVKGPFLEWLRKRLSFKLPE
jgi:hypothetical protein